jgi:hypothetical protein
MLGTAALDLAWLAAGRFDASITFSNQPWDIAAGVILAREAGAAVTDADGTPHTYTSTATIAATQPLIPQLIPLIQAARITEIPGTETPPPSSSVTADLDTILSRARYLIFDFDGPVRDPATGTPAGYIHEALAACRDSGRIPVITRAADWAEAVEYLKRQGISDLTGRLYGPRRASDDHGPVNADLLHDTITTLGASSSDCAVITATAATDHDASSTGFATIGYTAVPGADQQLAEAGADTLLPSLADMTLRLRARPLPN